MAKKEVGKIKLHVPAGKATPQPPIGPALGQRQVNIMEFCKAFNASTQHMEVGVLVPVVITVYADRTFTFLVKLPTISHYLRKAAKITKGSGETGKTAAVAKITWAQVREIASIKMADMNANDVEAAAKMVAGSAASMGIEVIGE